MLLAWFNKVAQLLVNRTNPTNTNKASSVIIARPFIKKTFFPGQYRTGKKDTGEKRKILPPMKNTSTTKNIKLYFTLILILKNIKKNFLTF